MNKKEELPIVKDTEKELNEELFDCRGLYQAYPCINTHVQVHVHMKTMISYSFMLSLRKCCSEFD